jgi:hypothetical protein
MSDRCTCHDTLIVKNLNRWFKEKWVDVSRKDKDGKHPPCGRSKAKKGSKGYPKCRPSVKVSSKTPKTSGEMTSGQKRAATKRKRAKKQGVGGKPTIVKSLVLVKQDGFPENMPDAAPELISVGSMLGVDAPETCTIPGCNNPPMMKARYANPLRSVDYTHHMCTEHAMQYEPDLAQVLVQKMNSTVHILKEHDDNLHDMAGMSNEEMAQLFLEENRKTTMNPNTPRPFAMMDYKKLQSELKPYLQAIMEGKGTPQSERINQLFEEINHRHIENHPTGHGTPFTDTRHSMELQDTFKSEPMNLAQVLVKSPVSPEAKRHKLEYDKKYESTPERVKYREELNRERRRRGIYGKGGPDMSHTKRHTLVAEDPHTNRARHFKERGTLKSTKPIDRELVLVTTGRL